jgi:hypothetical protein
MRNETRPLLPLINRSRRGAYALAGLGVAALILGLVALIVMGQGARTFFQAYLFGYIFWLNFSLGCFGLTLLHHVVRGSWGLPILRVLEAGARTLPLMAGLFVVVVLGMLFGDLYPWNNSRALQDGVMRHAVEAKASYLNPLWFIIRAVIYFGIWIGLSSFLNRSSLEQDRTGDASLAQERTNWSAPGMVVFFVSITFAVTDWVMSLDPRWYSTIFGVLFVTGQALTALAFSTLLMTRLVNYRPFSEIVTPQLTRDLGNLLLTLTMVWAYISLSQFLIMWAGNLPEEIAYYTTRNSGGWLPVGTVLILFQFFAPFLMLLSGRTKRTPGYLAGVATLILAMRVLDIAWIVIPFYQQAEQPVNANLAWMSVAALLGLGGIWLGAFTHQLRRHPLLPRHDPRLQEVLEHA